MERSDGDRTVDVTSGGSDPTDLFRPAITNTEASRTRRERPSKGQLFTALNAAPTKVIEGRGHGFVRLSGAGERSNSMEGVSDGLELDRPPRDAGRRSDDGDGPGDTPLRLVRLR